MYILSLMLKKYINQEVSIAFDSKFPKGFLTSIHIFRTHVFVKTIYYVEYYIVFDQNVPFRVIIFLMWKNNLNPHLKVNSD